MVTAIGESPLPGGGVTVTATVDEGSNSKVAEPEIPVDSLALSIPVATPPKRGNDIVVFGTDTVAPGISAPLGPVTSTVTSMVGTVKVPLSPLLKLTLLTVAVYVVGSPTDPERLTEYVPGGADSAKAPLEDVPPVATAMPVPLRIWIV